MPFHFIDDVAIADVAFTVWAGTLEQLLTDSVDALLQVMVSNVDSIRDKLTVQVELTNQELDLLLFNLLQEVLFEKDAHRLLLRVSELYLVSGDDGHRLQARLIGEPIDPVQHDLQVDVKAVTLYKFSLTATSKGWQAMVVLDI